MEDTRTVIRHDKPPHQFDAYDGLVVCRYCGCIAYAKGISTATFQKDLPKFCISYTEIVYGSIQELDKPE